MSWLHLLQNCDHILSKHSKRNSVHTPETKAATEKMSVLRTAEKVLGYTLNHFTLKNLLQNDRQLYRRIFELKANSW